MGHKKQKQGHSNIRKWCIGIHGTAHIQLCREFDLKQGCNYLSNEMWLEIDLNLDKQLHVEVDVEHAVVQYGLCK